MMVAFCGFSTFKAAMNTVATSSACANGVVGQVFEACSGLFRLLIYMLYRYPLFEIPHTLSSTAWPSAAEIYFLTSDMENFFMPFEWAKAIGSLWRKEICTDAGAEMSRSGKMHGMKNELN
jgi:hypothetical protein